MNVPRAIINKLLRDQMRYGEYYTYAKLYAIYLQIMNQDSFCDHFRMSEDTFQGLIRSWVASEGTWIGRKLGDDGRALFYKLEPIVNCPFLNLVEWVRGKVWR